MRGSRAPVVVFLVLTVKQHFKGTLLQVEEHPLGISCLYNITALQRSSCTGKTPVGVYLVLTVKHTSEELLYRLKSTSGSIFCLYNITALQRNSVTG